MKPHQLNKGDRIRLDDEEYVIDEIYQESHSEYHIGTVCGTGICVGIDEDIEVIK